MDLYHASSGPSTYPVSRPLPPATPSSQRRDQVLAERSPNVAGPQAKALQKLQAAGKMGSTMVTPPMPPSHCIAPIGFETSTPGTDSDTSGSAASPRRCFCGRNAECGGIYCSENAFSSLCYRPQAGPSRYSNASAVSTQSSASSLAPAQPTLDSFSSNPYPPSTWDSSSHYRRIARADARREERREERKRRRAEGSVASSSTRSTTLSTASSGSRLPDLVGGTGHSRNPSCASTMSSASEWTVGTTGGLSRNPSSASNASNGAAGSGNGWRGYRGDAVEVIREDEDESDTKYGPGSNKLREDSRPYPAPNTIAGPGHRRKQSHSTKKRIADPLGMGKDMRDILEEIISMEKTFSVEDDSVDGFESEASRGRSKSSSLAPETTPQGLFTAVFDRPPRTPSPAPIPVERRIPNAPGAPVRGHRNSMSVGHLLAPVSNLPLSGQLPLPTVMYGNERLARPPSFMGHHSSLSESHTALYLATASPEAPGPSRGGQARRSASPKMKSRNSITFTPEAAGPALPVPDINIEGSSISTPVSAPAFGHFGQSGFGLNTTPSRRRPQVSPNASYGSMGGWRFPSSRSNGSSSTLNLAATHTHFQLEQDTPRGPSLATPLSASSTSGFGSLATHDTSPLGAAHQASRILRRSNRDSDISMSESQSPHGASTSSSIGSPESMGRDAPHLLWPPPRHLEPSLFPTSPSGTDRGTPLAQLSSLNRGNPYGFSQSSLSLHSRIMESGQGRENENVHRRGATSPPTSAMKLGELLGSWARSSADTEDRPRRRDSGMEVDGEESTVHGHAFDRAKQMHDWAPVSGSDREYASRGLQEAPAGQVEWEDEEGEGLAYLRR